VHKAIRCRYQRRRDVPTAIRSSSYYIPPLSFTSTRCRDPFHPSLGYQCPTRFRHRERVWDSCAAARVVERVTAIEERGLVVSGCQDVPKSSRIMLMNQTFDAQTCITHLQLKRAPWNDAVPLEEEMISWRTNHVSSEILTPELTSKKILRVAGLHYSLSLFRGRFRITHSFYEQLRLIWQYWLSSGKDRDLEQRCFLGMLYIAPSRRTRRRGNSLIIDRGLRVLGRKWLCRLVFRFTTITHYNSLPESHHPESKEASGSRWLLRRMIHFPTGETDRDRDSNFPQQPSVSAM
jgi:hypothetical protein